MGSEQADRAMECRSCGSVATRADLDAGGYVNCCPERAMNEAIEEDYGLPALRALAQSESSR